MLRVQVRILKCPSKWTTPRILWRLERNGHVMEARLMPHAQYVAAVILVDGQVRAAQRSSTRPTPCAGPKSSECSEPAPMADRYDGTGRRNNRLIPV
jgi:hypothetical protein